MEQHMHAKMSAFARGFRTVSSLSSPLRSPRPLLRLLLVICAVVFSWVMLFSSKQNWSGIKGADSPTPVQSVANHVGSRFSNLTELTLTRFANFSHLASKCVANCSVPLLPESEYPPIRIVHFLAFLSNRTWATENIVRRQWVDMALSGLFDRMDKLYVVVQTINDTHVDWLKNLAFKDIGLPEFKVHFYVLYENLWEFPGIHVLWEAACRDARFDRSLFLYLHSKGATKLYRPYERWPDEMVPFYDVVMAWRHIIQIFRLNPDAQTIGFGRARRGFQWYNIFWARAAHLAQLQEPIVSTDRYYYERWLAHFVKPSRTHCDKVLKLVDESQPFNFSFTSAYLSERFRNPFGHSSDDNAEPHSDGAYGLFSCGMDSFDVPSIIAREKGRCRQLFQSEGVPEAQNICEIH